MRTFLFGKVGEVPVATIKGARMVKGEEDGTVIILDDNGKEIAFVTLQAGWHISDTGSSGNG